MNLKSFKKYFHDELKDLYSLEELDSLFFILINYYLQISKIAYIQNPQKQLNKLNIKKIYSKIKLLKENMPIQYVIGEVVHKKLKFNLNKSVLIPRPETEELCNWVISSTNKNNRILDIGTGSGFIAIILKKFIHDCEVEAWDISREALKLAKKNANTNNVKIDFKQVDILKNNISSSRFDVIVSNPPYVDYCEKNQINSRVKDYEPHDAIFVDHDDNMIFYKKIIEKSERLLNQNGVLYFESHSSRINILENLLKINNFKRIIIKEDLFGKKRMISAQK
tara:strand:- start:287 stop:1126 length:840 start_codon:yes stop_codon:yes gene_type:complete